MEVSYLFLHLLCIVVFAVVAPTARPTPRHPLLIVIQLLDFEVGKITLKLGDEFLGIIAYTILSLEYASGAYDHVAIKFRRLDADIDFNVCSPFYRVLSCYFSFFFFSVYWYNLLWLIAFSQSLLVILDSILA
ncbi:uncharacterized protein LOC132642884 isoform X2 [Lycium barbarum]|uniref:uncharacterized protein LOC132642884 isoform X2 n=1 Tax=Lycium barbarum TaxID=112863 RepID=UPI00293F3028|nr:uncharacterized protein LOC132642884 isoform X2 [Lycium barbarum]